MGEDNKLHVLFSPSFLNDIEELGNSVTISEYYVEDLRTEITNVVELLEDNITISYNRKPGNLTGFWDSDNNTLRVHLTLPSGVYSNSTTRDGKTLNILSHNLLNINNGEGLVRVFRFKYGKDLKTAFIVINDLVGRNLKPIECNQDRILINVKFPDTTKANIKAGRIEKDTKFLEGYGVFRGDNIFFASSYETLASRKSSIEYLNYTTTETTIQKKEVPYISNSGAGIYRRDSVRIYTGVSIYCSGLLKNIQPHTRPKLDKLGGVLRIYGDIKYLDYEIRGTEFIYIGEGTESIDGIPDVELILTEHELGLLDVSIVDKFYVKYGIYEGQSDPSVLIKAGIYFYNPITKNIEYIESKNIRLTQEEEVIPQWEIIYRSTEYTEPTSGEYIPVYLFPWELGYSHTFTIRTTLPDINIEQDFYMEYEDPVLQELFDYTIERIDSGLYPIVDYKVKLISKTSNLESKWLPIINNESIIKISTLILREYEYSESFYFVQGPKVQEIELHDSNDNNITEIILDANQTNAIYYPVAPEAREPEEIGERNTWVVLEVDNRVEPQETTGALNPNNPDNLENKLILDILAQSNGIVQTDIGKIVLGRVKESESGNVDGWRNIVSMGRVTIPITKRGSIESIRSEESIILEEINLYKIRVTSNGPFACWMNESDEYCFFNPDTDLPTYENHFYSRRYDPVDGCDVYIALYNTVRLNEEPIEVNKILFTVINEEPDWRSGERPECFNDQSNLAKCAVFIKAPENPEVSYINPADMYVFLDSNSKEIRFRSIETPSVDRLQTLENELQHSYYTYDIAFNSQPIPVYTTLDDYKYHKHEVQNLTDPFGYYPISPSYIYIVHSTNYTDSYCIFWLFMKAKEPSFYRTDFNGNTIFVDPNFNGAENENKKIIIIRSRYEIETADIVASLSVSGSFVINTISHTILESSNDYRHQYSIVLEFLLPNTGYQRTLGTLVITSRIYKLVTFNSSSNFILPSYTLTQGDIDRIVPPSIMRIPIVQLGSSGGDEGGIEVIGDREPVGISPGGETRNFIIRTELEIENPILDLDQDSEGFCTFSRISTEGFSFTVPSRSNTYNPEIPSDQHNYTDYSEPREIRFSLLINPVDINYQPYSEQFYFVQPGISNGLMYASPGGTPRLYLGDTEIIENVSYNTTELNVFLGVFNIENQIQEGDKGQTSNIKINTGYRILTSNATYTNQRWTPTVNLSFPENTTGMTVDRVFIITAGGNKITLTVKQLSASGNIICKDNAYFLSHGECIETEDYGNNMGFFTFDTDIDIKNLSLRIPESLLAEPYSFIYIGASPFGDGYTRYKAQIRLKPNLSNSVIKKQIFSFIRNGESIRNVYINQGYYCLTLYYPESISDGVYSGGTIGSSIHPIIVPSRDNLKYGTTRKLFEVALNRGEFNPETGRLNEETIDILNESVIRFPTINSFTWTTEIMLQSSRNSTEDLNLDLTAEITRDFLDSYETKLFKDSTDLTAKPFLENTYTVNPAYYESVFMIKVEASIRVEYPLTDPLRLSGRTTKHNYTIYLKKVSD